MLDMLMWVLRGILLAGMLFLGTRILTKKPKRRRDLDRLARKMVYFFRIQLGEDLRQIAPVEYVLDEGQVPGTLFLTSSSIWFFSEGRSPLRIPLSMVSEVRSEREGNVSKLIIEVRGGGVHVFKGNLLERWPLIVIRVREERRIS